MSNWLLASVFRIFTDMDILSVLETNAELFPNKVVYGYVDKDAKLSEELSYQELLQEVVGTSGLLGARYFRKSRIVILLPAESSFIISFLAALHAGLIAVPCPIGFSEAGINRILNIIQNCAASGIITNRKTYKMLFQRQTLASKLLEDSEIQWFFTDDLNNILPSTVLKKSVKENQAAYLQYTSGSTNAPKGVMISHENLLANLSAINHCFGRTANDVSITWLPHYHDMGLVDGLLSPLYTGGTALVMSPLLFVTKPFLLLKAMTDYKVSFSGGPGFGLDHCVSKIKAEQIAECDLSSLRGLYVGAEPIRLASLDRFSEAMKPAGFNKNCLIPAYGLAEATLAVSLHYAGTALTYKRENDGPKEILACGPPVENTEVVIVDPETREIQQDGAIGEIWVSNAGVALGYWNNPEATEETFKAYTNCEKGPYLRTGDLGFMLDGKLFITGRKKELIIIRGVNYYPQDIEEIVRESHEDIQPNATAAFAVDTVYGEALMIVTELKRATPTEEVIENVKIKIAHHIGAAFGLVPHEIMLIQTGKLPKTSSGKIQRLKAREIFNVN